MKKYLLLPTLCLCSILFTGGCTTVETTPPDTAYIIDIPSPTPTFEEFATDVFLDEVTTDTISLHYSLSRPENYGIAEYPITLGSVADAVSFDDNILTLYEQLLTYDADSLSGEDKLTYEALKYHFDLMLQNDFSPYLSELLGPTTGYQAQLPILLAEFRFESTEDIEHYLALLPCVYDYFKEIADFEKEKSAAGYFMNDETAKEIIKQCEDFAKNPDDNFLFSTFDERLNELSLSSSQKAEYILENQTALYTYIFPAYELLAETLTECLGTGTNNYGLCYFEDGKEFYELLVKHSTGTSRSMEEVKQLLKDAIQEGCNTMTVALAEEPAIYESALSPDFPETDPAEIVEFIKNRSADDFPYIDCNGYSIKYIPASLQDYVSPAMYLIPPIDKYNAGVIYINSNPLYDSDALFPTIAHEGYPGHLYQTVSVLSEDVHPLRYLLSSTGYEEGWATYVETYCYKYAGFSDALTSFLQADQIATLCLYALSDIYIHYDGYTPEQLSAFLSIYGFPEKSAALIYQTLLAEPGAYLPYAVGYLEFMELQNTARDLWGKKYSDYRFHEFLLTTGPLPFEMLGEMLQTN